MQTVSGYDPVMLNDDDAEWLASVPARIGEADREVTQLRNVARSQTRPMTNLVAADAAVSARFGMAA